MICVAHIANTLMQTHYAADKAREARDCGDLAAAAWWDRVKVDVDAAPPLTETQRSRLAVLLRPRDPVPQSRRARVSPSDVA